MNLIVTTNCIEVIPIQSGNGFVHIQVEEVKPIDYYNTIIHKINISSFQDQFQDFIINIPKNKLIDFKIEQIKKLLLVFKRHKRGLFNVVGDIESFLFGTMDSNDKEEIMKAIYDNEDNNFNIAKKINEQIYINYQIEEEFKNLSNTINNNNKEFVKLFKQNKNKLDEISERFNEKSILDNTFNQLIIFYNFIHKVTQTIILSKQEIVDMSLLSDEEIKNISFEQIKYLKVKLFVDKNIIIIILQKPVFSNEICKIVKLYSVPNLNNKEIINIPEKLIKCNNKILDLNFKVVQDNCIKELFKPKIENCQYTNNLEQKVIADIPGIIITINMKEITLLQNCNQDKIKIKGNNVLKFNNCTINIYGKNYNSYETFNDYQFINNEIKTIKPIIFKPQIEEIKEYHFENIKEMTLVKRINYVNYAINIVLTILLISIIIFGVVKFNKKKNANNAIVTLNSKIDEDIKLKEGGVTSGEALFHVSEF